MHRQFCYRFRYDKYNNQSSWATWAMFWTLSIFEFSRSNIFSTLFPSLKNKSHAEYREQIPHAGSHKFEFHNCQCFEDEQ